VAEAANHFSLIRDPDLLRWFADHPGDDLATQCEYARVWLERDVLPGYRDVDAAGVDLDAWFADRDVQAYVERLDRQSARLRDVPTPAESLPADWLLAMEAPSPETGDFELSDELEDSDASSSDGPVRWKPLAFAGAGLLLVSVLVLAVQRNRDRPPIPEQSTTAQRSTNRTSNAQKPAQELSSAAQQQPTASLRPRTITPTAKLEPLRVDAPDAQQLTALIQGWLDSKASALQGQPAQLAVVARPRLTEAVNQQRAADVAAGRTLVVNASVTALELVSRKPSRIEVQADVAYSDSLVDGSGVVLKRTEPRTLELTYILGRDGDQWRLTAYMPRS